MTRAFTVARVSAALVAILVAFLFVDYVIATTQKPKDDARIAELQKQVQQKAALAPVLAGFQKQVTQARAARKLRLRWLAWLLIISAATFIGSAKWYLEGRPKAAAIQKPKPAGEAAAIVPTATSKPAAPVSPPPIDLAFVDQIIEREGTSKEAAIPILQAIQDHYRYLPDEALRRVCEATKITPAQLAGTSTFYSRFRHAPVGEHIVRVCHGTACYVTGARQISEELRRHLQIPDNSDTDPARLFTVEEVACLGCCSLAPVLMVDDQTTGKLTPAKACVALETARPKEPA